MRRSFVEVGRRTEDRRRGIAGVRKRGSWWRIRERRRVPEQAERRWRVGRGVVRRRGIVGPRRRGRLMRMCW